MWKLIELEWRKLERNKVIGEVIIYWLIIMGLPSFLLKVVYADLPAARFTESYAAAFELMLPIQMGFLLFGASMINHVFIEEYKNKTMALSFGYPLSRKRLVTGKVLFIALIVFFCTLISFIFAGMATFVFDQVVDVIAGSSTLMDLITYVVKAVIFSLMIALASLTPLFWFGIWKRAIIPTVICAILMMQSPTVIHLLRISLDLNWLTALLSLFGAASVGLSVALVNRLGDL